MDISIADIKSALQEELSVIPGAPNPDQPDPASFVNFKLVPMNYRAMVNRLVLEAISGSNPVGAADLIVRLLSTPDQK